MRRPPPYPAARRPTLLSRRLDRGPSMFNKVDVDGRYAVVTGGARWIGRAIAKSLFFGVGCGHLGSQSSARRQNHNGV